MRQQYRVKLTERAERTGEVLVLAGSFDSAETKARILWEQDKVPLKDGPLDLEITSVEIPRAKGRRR